MNWAVLFRKSATVLLFFTTYISLAQQDPLNSPVHLTKKKITLRQVIEQTEQQVTLKFSFNPNQLPLGKKLTISGSIDTLKKLLDYLSAEAHLEYSIIERQIVLKMLPATPDATKDKITIHGIIKDAATGETLIGATVYIPGIGSGVATNTYGFYSLTIPKGEYAVEISYIGYEPNVRTIVLSSDEVIDVNMNHATSVLDEIVVISLPSRSFEDIQTSKIVLQGKAITEIPAAFGEQDVLKSLETIPGITLQSDGSTFFHVRGGEKDQNLILIDEAPIYNPTHLIGLFSTILPEAVKTIDIYKGNAPASKGGRLSSVIDIKTRVGNNKHFGAWGSVGLVSTQLGIEGPFKIDKSSYMLTGRLSRLKWYFKQNNPTLQKFQFSDLTGKVNFKLRNRDKLYFSFYTGSDNFEIDNSGLAWNNFAGTVRWNHLFNKKLFANTTLYGSNYEYFLIIDNNKGDKWRSRIGNISLKTDFSYYIKPNNLLQFGIALAGHTINPGNIVTEDAIPFNQIVSVRNVAETVLYINHELRLNKHVGIQYGARLTSWTNLGSAFEFVFNNQHQPIDTLFFDPGEDYNSFDNLEPRVNISYFINRHSTIKFGYARNVQNLHLISNSNTPFSSFEVWLPSSLNILPEKADQVSLSYTHFLEKQGVTLEIDGYIKQLMNQIDYAPHAETLLNQTLESTLRFGEAHSYGVEIMARKQQGRLRGLGGYTFSRVKRKFDDINGGLEFNGHADRPHQIDLVFAYDLTKRWTLGFTWIYNSGIPVSKPTGFYSYNGAEVPIYARKNNSRLPDYHRLDLSASLKLNKNLDARFIHSLSIAIYNAYGRKNPLFINFNKTESADGDFETPGNIFLTQRVTTQTYIYTFTPSITYLFSFQ